MKEIKNAFVPEISPIHKVEFSVATQLTIEGANLQKDIIPAGTLVKATNAGKRIELEPDKGAKIAVVGDAGEALGVLMHDVKVADGATQSVGVMIKGVVYDDVMEQANTKTNWTEAVKEALLPFITTYAVITLKK